MHDKNKRASAFIETISILVGLMLLSFGAYITFMVVTPMKDSFNADPEVTPAAQDVINTGTTNVLNAQDYMFFSFLILSWLVAISLAIFVEVHPIWFWLNFALSIFVFAFAFAIRSAYFDFSSAPEAAIYTSSLPITAFIMGNLVKVIIVYYFTVLLATLGKRVMMR